MPFHIRSTHQIRCTPKMIPNLVVNHDRGGGDLVVALGRESLRFTTGGTGGAGGAVDLSQLSHEGVRLGFRSVVAAEADVGGVVELHIHGQDDASLGNGIQVQVLGRSKGGRQRATNGNR